MRKAAGEEGTTLPLIFGFFAMALALIIVATAATSLYLERARLYTLADGAALAAANSMAVDAALAAADPAAVGPGARSHDTALSRGTARKLHAAASGYLSVATRGRRNPVTLISAASPDGRGARVQLSTTWRPPIVTPFVPRGIDIEATANARPVFH